MVFFKRHILMKKLLIASAVARSLSSLGASAGVISAGGIQWDSLGSKGVSAQFNFQQWFAVDGTATSTDYNGTASMVDDYQRINSDTAVAGAVGRELAGVGEFYSFFDHREPPSFCVNPNFELTFAFGGLKVLTVGTNPIDASFDTTKAWFNIYLDPGTDFDGPGAFDTTLSSTAHHKFVEAQNGNLWLALDFDTFILDGTVIGGEAEATVSVRNIAGLGSDEAKAA
jgi:hypothetical protein